jgi:hypothetical protein
MLRKEFHLKQSNLPSYQIEYAKMEKFQMEVITNAPKMLKATNEKKTSCFMD